MLATSERLFAESGSYLGLAGELELKESDPIGYEKLFSRLRGGLVSARETALNISASPIVRELGELCFALYTPEGDSIALSTGIIVHVHTMSDAIKWMVRQGYEDNPGIRPGDIFANNDPTIGDVHNADVQTFVPIFDLSDPDNPELVAWAGGVTHVLDIGASTPGGVPVGPTNRLDDGIDLPCMKIGERDEIARWHLERCAKQTRAPMYYLLDERTRLAGCHMVREAVERVILEEGIDRFKQFSREVIEEGRRSFKSRIREMTVPGRYRAASFMDNTYADKVQLPARARRDFVMHAPFEVRIGGDGDYALDLDGSSAWGWHSMNCTPSGMQGAIWVMFTQTLICNDKVNDGAYLAVETNFPEGSIANLGDAEGSTGIAWAFLQPAFTGYPRTLSRALQARGFIEEVIGAYSVSGNVIQGGGDGPVRQLLGDHELRDRGPGDGGEVRARRHRHLRGDVQPRGRRRRRRDVGADLPDGLPLAADQAEHGRPGTPSRRLELRVAAVDLEHAVLGAAEPGHLAAVHLAGDLRRLSGLGRLHPQHPRQQPAGAGRGGRGLPGRGRVLRRPGADGDRGRARVQARQLHPAQPVRRGRPLPLGDEGRGRSRRSAGAPGRGGGARRRRGPHRAPSTPSASTRSTTARVPAAGGSSAHGRPSEWWETERERVLAGDLIEPIKTGYEESIKLSPRWAAEFRGFWDLPEDFSFGVETPTVPADLAPVAGKVTPDESAAEFLAGSEVARVEPPALAGKPLEPETLAALLDERLSRREVKDIQSGYKDPDRFDEVGRAAGEPGGVGRSDRPAARRGAQRRPPPRRWRTR